MCKKFCVTLALAALLVGGLVLFTPETSDAAQPPNGSYAQTCKNVVVKNGTLQATCQTINGKWKNTRLSMQMLPCKDISNENGTLVCQ